MRVWIASILIVLGAGVSAQLAQVKWTHALPVDAHSAKIASLPDGSFVVAIARARIGVDEFVEVRKVSATGEVLWSRNEPLALAKLLVYSNGDVSVYGPDLYGIIRVRRVKPDGSFRWWSSQPFTVGTPQQDFSAKLGPSDWIYVGGRAKQGTARGDVFAIDQNGYVRWGAQPDPELGSETRIAAVGSNSDVVFVSSTSISGSPAAFPVRLRGYYIFRRLEKIPYASRAWVADPAGFYYRGGTRNGVSGYVEKVDLEMNLVWTTLTPSPVLDMKVDTWGNVVPRLENGNLLRIRPDGSIKTTSTMTYGPNHLGVLDYAIDKYGRHTVASKSSSTSLLLFGDAWTPVRWSLPLSGRAHELAVNHSTGDSLSVVETSGTGRLTLRCVEQVPEAILDSIQVTRSLLHAGNVLMNDRYVGTGRAELIEGPANGFLNFFPDGSYTYRASPGFSGRDLVRYRITKPGLNPAVGRLQIEVLR